MRKRIAAAVLAACVNLLGAVNADALVTPADDDDGPDGVDTIEFGKVEHQGRELAGANVAAGAAAAGEPLERVWIARTAEGAWAAVAVRQGASDVAWIDVRSSAANIPPEVALDQLLGRALTFCADRGALKLVVRPATLPIGLACCFVESHGFQFSRLRAIQGVDHLEFYRDLYRRTPDAT